MCFGSHFALVALPVSKGQTADVATNFGVKFNVRVTSASPPRSVDVQIMG
jgi:hypothetical protein